MVFVEDAMGDLRKPARMAFGRIEVLGLSGRVRDVLVVETGGFRGKETVHVEFPR